jgi:hypothetical protein
MSTCSYIGKFVGSDTAPQEHHVHLRVLCCAEALMIATDGGLPDYDMPFVLRRSSTIGHHTVCVSVSWTTRYSLL